MAGRTLMGWRPDVRWLLPTSTHPGTDNEAFGQDVDRLCNGKTAGGGYRANAGFLGEVCCQQGSDVLYK